MKRFILLAVAAVVAACNNEITGLGPPSDPATEVFAPSLGVNIAAMTKLPNGVYIQDILVGSGDSVTARTDTVWITYDGFLKDGTEFDDGNNTRFLMAELVVGMREGMLGMRVGGRRKIVIPSELGYGSTTVKNRATGEIIVPRQSTLIFNVELIKVHNVEPTTPGS